jgi:hypothetical protein
MMICSNMDTLLYQVKETPLFPVERPFFPST